MDCIYSSQGSRPWRSTQREAEHYKIGRRQITVLFNIIPMGYRGTLREDTI
ncbi:hypothetical protein DSM101010T_16100 [Desulfovibrio subterraneus]|uniref:Uncharacterized protein n=1 Tax=Desulfovibrio subterraneus TaxID=2718620 RepID=A0A7J0BJC5_9BACT|nr:hypothetical protein DSM101010T_16100 [Desulfovibrio subterraneus]